MPKAKTAAPSGVERIQRPEPLTLRGSTIFEGDALTVLRRLPSGSVRCVVTSPPYWGLRDYSIEDQFSAAEAANRLRVRPQAVPGCIKVDEVARRYGVSQTTLYKHVGVITPHQ